MELAAGVDLRQLLGRAQPPKRLGQPRPRNDARPIRIRAGHGPVLGDVRTREHAHRLRKRQPLFGRDPVRLLEARHHPLQALAVHLDPLAANEREPIGAGQDLLHVTRAQALAVESDLHAKVEQGILAQRSRCLRPDGGRHLRPGGAPAPPRRGHANHHAGTLQLRHVTQKLKCLARRPAQRVKDLARIDRLSQPRAGFRRALDRQQERQQLLLAARARVRAQGLPERQVLGLAVGREPVGVSREKGERRRFVLAILGEVEVDLAHDVPGRMEIF